MGEQMMLKKFALWFTYFGLSFLLERCGVAEQGKVFMCLWLGTGILCVLITLVICVFVCIGKGDAAKANAISFLAILCAAGGIAIVLFATQVAAMIFNVDFYVAFQIMTFGKCLSNSNKKKEK